MVLSHRGNIWIGPWAIFLQYADPNLDTNNGRDLNFKGLCGHMMGVMEKSTYYCLKRILDALQHFYHDRTSLWVHNIVEILPKCHPLESFLGL